MMNPIIIVGGGPVGAVLALILAKAGIPVKILEARPQGASHGDQRALALSFGSRRILDKLGVWTDLSPLATSIQTIHVSQKGSLGRTLLKAGDYQLEALGYVLSYGALSAALEKALSTLPNVEMLFEANAEHIYQDAQEASVSYRMDGEGYLLESNLVVLADGGRSAELAHLERDTKEYGDDALITKVVAELPHHNIAYERFTPEGPIALLPNGERDFSLVWTGKKELIAPLLMLNDDEFLKQFHAQFGDRVGRFLSVGKRVCFPLKMSKLQPTQTPHLVVIGNAAQTMHPVAGQGFNVGLRDAESLAKHILTATPEQLGGVEMLKQYQASRTRDTKGGLLFTDFLVNTFTNDLLGVPRFRSMGLGILDVLKPVKKQLVNKMSFGK
ncbi:MAG: 2-octaprenyl-6-methoxyphenyl hydroxylase [Methylotenera sp.]|nr:MAG: 2-octaprenyl-6-methoxyphenyl hydroxylase [Methylotenera sp.]